LHKWKKGEEKRPDLPQGIGKSREIDTGDEYIFCNYHTMPHRSPGPTKLGQEHSFRRYRKSCAVEISPPSPKVGV
jgi:hypothetical protein